MEVKRVTLDIFPEEELDLKELGGQKNEPEEDHLDDYYTFDYMTGKIKKSESRRIELYDDSIESVNASLKKFSTELVGMGFAVVFANYDIVTKEVEHNLDYDGQDAELHIDVDYKGCDIRYYPNEDGISALMKVDKKEDSRAKQEHIDKVEEFIQYTKDNPNWVSKPDEYRLVSEECYSYNDEIENKDEISAKAGKINGEDSLIFQPRDGVKLVYSLERNYMMGSSQDGVVKLKKGLQDVCKSLGIDEPEFQYYPRYNKIKIKEEDEETKQEKEEDSKGLFS